MEIDTTPRIDFRLGIFNDDSSNPPFTFTSPSPNIESPSPTLSQLVLSPSSLPAKPSCQQCTGRKYDFTSYFHNTSIFPEPPHEFLVLVEDVYGLKNRLQSLLVTYIWHGIPDDYLGTDDEYVGEVRRQLAEWEKLNSELGDVVLACGVEREKVGVVLNEVRAWVQRMAKDIEDHVVGMRNMGVTREGMKGMVKAFRKEWEKVWDVCMRERQGTLGCMDWSSRGREGWEKLEENVWGAIGASNCAGFKGIKGQM